MSSKMTKRQQKLIDAAGLAESDEEQVAAFKDAINEIDPERLPLIALLMRQKDDSLDEILIREYFRDSVSRKC